MRRDSRVRSVSTENLGAEPPMGSKDMGERRKPYSGPASLTQKLGWVTPELDR